MHPKYRAAFLFIVVLCSVPFASADETSKAAKIEQMFQLTKTDQMMRQVLTQLKAAQMQEMGKRNVTAETTRKLNDLLGAAMSWERMKPRYIKLYADAFSEEELGSIVAFYKSPAGRAMLDKQPMLIHQSLGIAQELVAGLKPEMERIVRGETAR